MRMTDHRAKAARIEGSLEKCRSSDYETVVEGCMLAGTHWFNILLHGAGISPEDRDTMHAEFMSAADRRRLRALFPEALEAMDQIEALRTAHVRGDLPGGADAASVARACLETLRTVASAVIQTATAARR